MNGLLGLWGSIKVSWILGFGEYLYSFNFNESESLKIDSKAFQVKCFSLYEEKDYIQWRHDLLSEGYTSISIVERSGDIDMIIILDYSIIKDFKRIKRI